MTVDNNDRDSEFGAQTRIDEDNSRRDELVMENLWVVRSVAARLAAKLPSSVDFADLHGAGVLGLMDAADKFDTTRGARFREVDAARTAVEQRTYDRATVAELAQELDLTVDQCHHLLMQVNAISFYEADIPGQEKRMGHLSSSEACNPLMQLETKARIELVFEAIETLSERHKLVLWLYYYEELTMKEVGSVMEVNEARVSQLHSKAIANLRREVSERLYCQNMSSER
jgi:RNA polymerase sigma factor for flagellar operon FliA